MTTARDLVKRAMRLAGVYSIGEEPSASEAQDVLQAMNAMLSSWANQSLLIFAESNDLIPFVANQQSVTVGPSGAFVTVRPVKVLDSSVIQFGGINYPLSVVTLDQMNDIAVVVSSIPSSLQVQYNMPNALIRLYPSPSQAMTLSLWSQKPLTGVTTLDDVFSLPPGYEDAIAYNLAAAIAPEFGASLPPIVAQRAMTLLKVLKRTNFKALVSQLPDAVMQRGFTYGNPYPWI